MRGEISRCPPFVREHPAPPWCCWCYLRQGSTTAPPLFISINRPIHFPNTPTYPFPSELINSLAFCSQEGVFVTGEDPPLRPPGVLGVTSVRGLPPHSHFSFQYTDLSFSLGAHSFVGILFAGGRICSLSCAWSDIT